MFRLLTDANELRSANEGTSQMNWRLVSASKPVTGNDFAGAPQSFKWSCTGTEYWVPQKTFFRMQYRLTKSNAARTPLAFEDHIAPEVDLCAHAFQSAEFRIGGRTVNTVNDRIPQIQALKRRLYKSKGQKSFLDSIAHTEIDMGTRADRHISNPIFKERTYSSAAHSSNNRLITITTNATTTTINMHDSSGVGGAASTAITDPVRSHSVVGNYLHFTVNTNTGVKTAPVRILAVTAGDGTAFVGAADGTGVAGSATSINYIVERCPHLYPADNNKAVTQINLAARMLHDSEYVSDTRPEAETFWSPPLGIFDVKHAMPAGEYELYLTPKPAADFTRVIESWLSDATKTHGVGANDYTFTVEKFELYVATIQGPRFDSGTYLLDLDGIGCRAERVQSTDDERIMDVSPSTHALTVAYQDDRVLTDSAMSASKFNAYSLDRRMNLSNQLTNLYVQYAGQTYPQPHYSPELSDGKDLMCKLYLDTQLALNGHQDVGGTESFSEWRQNGPFYHIRTPKDGMDRSTRVNINHRFAFPAGQGTNVNALLFDHYYEVCTVSVTDGRVTSVTVQKA